MPSSQVPRQSTSYKKSHTQQSLSGKKGGKKYISKQRMQQRIKNESNIFNSLPSGRLVNVFMPYVSLLKTQKNKRLSTIKEEQAQKVRKMGKNPKRFNTPDIRFNNRFIGPHISVWHPQNFWHISRRRRIFRNSRRGNPIRRPRTVIENYIDDNSINKNGFKKVMERHHKDKQSRVSYTQRKYLEAMKRNNPKEYKQLLMSNPLFRKWDERQKNGNYE